MFCGALGAGRRGPPGKKGGGTAWVRRHAGLGLGERKTAGAPGFFIGKRILRRGGGPKAVAGRAGGGDFEPRAPRKIAINLRIITLF
mgnify:FL=1